MSFRQRLAYQSIRWLPWWLSGCSFVAGTGTFNRVKALGLETKEAHEVGLNGVIECCAVFGQLFGYLSFSCLLGFSGFLVGSVARHYMMRTSRYHALKSDIMFESVVHKF